MSENDETPRVPRDPDPDSSEIDMVMGENKSGGEGVMSDLYREWIPDGDDWLAKTTLAPEQAVLIPSLIAQVKTEPHVTPETEEAVLLWTEMLMKGQTSIDGQSREDIIRSFETAGSKSSGAMVIGSVGEEASEDDDDDDGGLFGGLF